MEQRSDLEIIDLREPQELHEGSIPGSQLMPFREIAHGRLILPKDHPLLLICAVGGRSYMVGQYFSRKAYPEIYNLEGGSCLETGGAAAGTALAAGSNKKATASYRVPGSYHSKYRPVSSLTTLESMSRPIRLGMAINPLARSEKFQTNSSFVIEPTITMLTKTTR